MTTQELGGHDDLGLEEDWDVRSVVDFVRENGLRIVIATVVAGVIGIGASFLMRPRFVATTSFLQPQQPQSAAASALAALGPLTALAGVGGATRTAGDQFAALLKSVTITDRMIDRFKLQQEYEVDFRSDARKILDQRMQVNVGKKDGFITVSVEDTSRERAAAMANQYVEELRKLTATLAITEAQQRRLFFEQMLQTSRERLLKAQLELQGTGFNPGALKAEPKAAAESYARLKAEAAAMEVKLQAVRRNFTENAPEVQNIAAALGALRSQLAGAENSVRSDGGPDYIGKYREFKYQEALFELYARQYEMARLDESREGTLIQVVDQAEPPEKKVKPARIIWLVIGSAGGLLLGLIWGWVRAQRAGR